MVKPEDRWSERSHDPVPGDSVTYPAEARLLQRFFPGETRRGAAKTGLTRALSLRLGG
jgi:hypothetical protein